MTSAYASGIVSPTSTHAVFEWLEIHALCTRQLRLCMVHTATIWDQILHHCSLSALHKCDPCCVRNAKFPIPLKEKRPYLTEFVCPSFHGFSHKEKVIIGRIKYSQSEMNPPRSIPKNSFCTPTKSLSSAFLLFLLRLCGFLAVYARCLHNSQGHKWRKLAWV